MNKSILRLCAFVLLCTAFIIPARAVEGVYLTYADFQKGNLIKADEKTFSGNNKRIKMKVNGEKREYDSKQIWGYLFRDKHLYRFIEYKGYLYDCELRFAGDMCWWSHNYEGELINDPMVVGREMQFVSYGMNGTAFVVGYTKQMQEAVAKQKELKPLLECTEGKKKVAVTATYTQNGVSSTGREQNTQNYVIKALTCMQEMPGYISDRSKAIPEPKN